jgi:dTDP-4-dehydrorhamnose reductase
MEKILITGGSGRVGSYLCQRARVMGWEVHGTFFSHELPLPGILFYRLDLASEREIGECIRLIRPAVVIHGAAIPKEVEWDLLLAINVRATAILARICADMGIFLIYVSTDLAFDGTKGLYKEEDAVNPVGPYPLSKVMAEEEVREGGGETAIARIPINYGWTASRSTFLEWILKEGCAGRPVTLFCDQFRSPIYLGNLAEATLEIARRRLTGTWHLAGSERVTRYEFGLAAASLLGFPEKWLLPAKLNDTLFKGSTCADCSLEVSKAARLLNVPLLRTREGLQAARDEQGGPCGNWFTGKGE